MKQAPSSPPGRNNLPLRLDAFVGRDDDLERLSDLLDDCRLVTLTGGPGMGKTRLSVEVARTVADDYPEGVWLVALAPVAKAESVGQAVASVLDVRERSGDDVAHSLISRIGKDRILLVLDNCEHVLDAAARLAEALVEACPNLSILATSQERLNVTGEHVWPVSGLDLPDESRSGDAAQTQAHAVRLFDERARAAVPTFDLHAGNLGSVVDICRRLDGIPLAIELAAARVGTFSPARIARHLDDRFVFLTGGKRSALARHQTLRAAVDWSYDLLSEPEQILLRRLSIFAGGATLDAIAAVCGDDGIDVVDIVTTLVARSLVVADTTATEASASEAKTPEATATEDRYRLLETIRFYGRDRLTEADELPTLAARHLGWCINLAESAEADLNGPNQRTWLDRLEADHDNLRAALTWSIDHGYNGDALRLAGALAMFWRINSHFAEGHDWLDRPLATTVEASPGPSEGAGAGDNPGAARAGRPGSAEVSSALILAKALWGKALLALMVQNFEEAGPAAKESLALYRDLDDPRGIARSLLLLGSGADGHSASRNIAYLQQSIVIARRVGDDWCLAYCLAVCGSHINEIGDYSAARSMLEESITIARSSRDRQGLNYGLISLGMAAACRGDYVAAEQLLGEALPAADTPYESATVLTELAGIAIATGNYDRAHALLDRAAQEHSLDAGPREPTDLRITRGRLALAEGDFDGAEVLFTRCVEDLRSAGGSSSNAVHGLGDVALARGDAAGALSPLSEALALAGSTGDKRRIASVLYSMGNAYRLGGDLREATSIHRQALDMRVEVEYMRGTLASVEALAGLLAKTGKVERAARVLACAQAARDKLGCDRSLAERIAYDSDRAAIAEAMDDVAFDASWTMGTSMPLEAAVALVASAKRSRGGRPAAGAASLTDAERQVARLALERLTNGEIAERLFVSTATVKSHLYRVFAKLSVTSRAELISRYADEGL